jgi:hypothetical protein
MAPSQKTMPSIAPFPPFLYALALGGKGGNLDSNARPLEPLRPVFGPWIIRDGVNDLPQNDKTDFSYGANWTYGEDNGNGAVAFKVSPPKGSPNTPVISNLERVYTETAPNTYEDQIKVTWDGAAGAVSYKVYWSTTETPRPGEPGFSGGEQTGINTTETFIPSAEHNPQLAYYVWVVAVNTATGLSSTPGATVSSASEMAYTVNDSAALEAAKPALAGSRVRNHTVTVSGGVSNTTPVRVANPGADTKTVTITGAGPGAAITGGGGDLLTIESGEVTLSGELTLDGGGGNVVTVSSGGELVLRDNAIVTGSGDVLHSGGVVVNGGHFTMKGGKVWGNGKNGVYVGNLGRFDMEGGKIGANTEYGMKWYSTVDWVVGRIPNATINKTGGIVYGTSPSHPTILGTAAPENANGAGSFGDTAETYGEGNEYSVTP